jgi:hypothetical protein
LAELVPELPQQLTKVVVEQLQERAAEHGVKASDLLTIPELRHPTDVSLDGLISPLDALMVIGHLNRHDLARVSESAEGELTRYDVSGDGVVSPVDALYVITELNHGQQTGGPWWHVEGGVNEVVAETLEHVRKVLAEQGLDQVADHIAHVNELVTAHLDRIEQAVRDRLRERDHEDVADDVLESLRQTRDRIREHLACLEDSVEQHVAYVRDGFYDELTADDEVSLTRSEVDSLLNRRLRDTQRLRERGEGESVAWHRDYVKNMVDQHIDYVREGRDVDEIYTLIGDHVDYVVELFDIHGVAAPRLSFVGGVLDHVQHVHAWIDGSAEGEGESGECPCEPVHVPESVQEHLDAAERHVAYVRELVEEHLETLRGRLRELHEEVRELVSSHIQFVKDLLDRHGV